MHKIKNIVLVLLVIPSLAFSDVMVSRQISTGEFIEMQSAARPGTLRENAVQQGYQAEDVEEIKMSEAEFKAFMEAREWGNDLSLAKNKRIIKLREDGRYALQNMTGYALGNATTRADILTAVRQAFVTAKTTVNACADVPCVKAVKPVWPVDPGE